MYEKIAKSAHSGESEVGDVSSLRLTLADARWLSVRATREGLVDTVVLWFSLQLDEAANLVLSTRPRGLPRDEGEVAAAASSVGADAADVAGGV